MRSEMRSSVTIATRGGGPLGGGAFAGADAHAAVTIPTSAHRHDTDAAYSFLPQRAALTAATTRGIKLGHDECARDEDRSCEGTERGGEALRGARRCILP